MEDGERTKISCGRFLLLLSQGVIMGIGAVLPGISGGVLCVIFGIYQPMMETLAHPKKGIKKYGHMVLPVVLGFLGGFVLLAGAIAKLASSEPAIVTSLFVGLIVGTLPQLFRDGAKQGRDKSCYIALAASTSLLLGFFMLLKYGTELHITPNAGWFFFCGALWGISMVALGSAVLLMISVAGTVLMLLGLYYPMSEGIAALDMGVIIPFLLGIAITVIALARAVNALFNRYYGIAYHCIIGFVIASTVPIIPVSFRSTSELIWSIVAATAGCAAAYFISRIDGLKE